MAFFVLLAILLNAFVSSTLITITETNSACSASYTAKPTVWQTENATSTTNVWSTQGGTATPSANGGPTLVPGPAPSSSPGDLGHLTPNTTGTMYYCAGTTLDSCSEMMVQINATFNFPTIVLEHSAYIARIVWTESQLEIYFNSVGAYNFIKRSWNLPEASLIPRDLTTPFVIGSTAFEGTGNQRDYFLVNKVHYDDSNMRVACYGTDLDLEGAIDDLGIQWGSYTPGANNTGQNPSSSMSSSITNTGPAPQTSLTTFVTVLPATTVVTTENIPTPYPTFVAINSTSESSTLIVRTAPPVTITQTSSVTLTQTSLIISTSTVLSTSVVSTTVQVPTTVLATTTLSAGQVITETSLVPTTVVQSTTIERPTTIVVTTTLDGGEQSTYTTTTTTSIVQTSTVEATTTVLATTTISNEVTTTYVSTYSTTLVQPTTIVETSLVATEIEVTSTSFSTTTLLSTITPDPMTITSVSTYSTEILVVNTISASTYTTTLPPQTVTITSTVDSCGSFPSSTTNGMPAATCGSDFDSRLDAQHGYYNFAANGSQLEEFAPGANLTQQDLGYGSGNTTLSRRELHLLRKRGFWSSLKKVASAVTSAVKTVTAAAVNVTRNIPIVSQIVQTVAKQVNTIVDVATTAVSLVTNQPTTAGVRFTLPIGMRAPNNADSPWGRAYKIFDCGEACGGEDAGNKETVADLWSKNGLLPVLNALGVPEEPEPGIRVYCVNCGVDGSFSVSGSITVQLSSGVRDAEISLQGNLHAGVSLGVEFLAVYEREIGRYRLLEVGVPGFSIPGIITVGPQVTLDIAATLTIEAQGQAIAGFHYYLTGFEQTINFVDRSRSRSKGWTPRVEHVFNAMGSLSATAELGMPIGIVVGVSLLGGRYSLTAGIVDTPSIDFTASYSISIDETGVTMNDGNCNGIEWYIDLRNRIQAVYPGNTLLLGQWNGPTLAAGCLGARPAQTPPPVVTRRPTATSSLRPTITSASPYTLTPCVPIIRNGDFGDSLASPTASPWQISVSPADTGNTWTFTTGYRTSRGIQGAVRRSPSSSFSNIVLTQNATLVRGANYSLSMSFMYGQQTGSCYLNAFMDGVYIWSLYDGNMPGSVGNWVDHTAPVFTAANANGVLTVYFTCVAGQSNTYSLDNVRFNLISMPAGITCPSSTTSSIRTTSSVAAVSGVTCGGFADQSVYTGSDGSTYRIQCGWDYHPGSRGETLRYYPTFGQCINACVAAGTSCYAVSFVPDRTTTNCYLKGSTFYRQFPGIVVHSVVRLTGPRVKRQAETDGPSTPGDLTAIADANITFGSPIYDAAAAAAAESQFQIIDITNSSSGSNNNSSGDGFTLPSLNSTLAASANATLELLALVNNNNTNTSVPAALDDTTLGTAWTTLHDTTHTLMLSASLDGNLNLVPSTPPTAEAASNFQTSLLFATISSVSGIITSDYQNRMLVYFPSSISAYNASRLRLVDEPYVPRGSRIVTLTPFVIPSSINNTSSSSSTSSTTSQGQGQGQRQEQEQVVYVAVDTAGEMFQLAWCVMRGGGNKVFVVGDAASGLESLRGEEVRWSVTGGIVETCETLAVSSSGVEGMDVGSGSGSEEEGV